MRSCLDTALTVSKISFFTTTTVGMTCVFFKTIETLNNANKTIDSVNKLCRKKNIESVNNILDKTNAVVTDLSSRYKQGGFLGILFNNNN